MKNPHSFKNAGFAYLAWIIWYVLVMMIGGLIQGFLNMSSVVTSYIFLGIVELLLLVPTLVYYLITHAPKPVIFGNPVNAAQLLCAAGIGILLVPALIGVSVLSQGVIVALGGSPLEASVPSSATFPQLLLGILCIGITAAIAEEPFFRGVQLTSIASVGGKRIALFLSALLFALAHGSLQGLPTLFIAGLILGIVRWNTGSLWPCLVLHACYNGASVCFDYFIGKIALPESLSGQNIIGAVDYFTSGFVWMLLAIPITAVIVLLFACMRRATPRSRVWSSAAWLRHEYRPWHAVMWVAAGCISLLIVLIIGAMSFIPALSGGGSI